MLHNPRNGSGLRGRTTVAGVTYHPSGQQPYDPYAPAQPYDPYNSSPPVLGGYPQQPGYQQYPAYQQPMGYVAPQQLQPQGLAVTGMVLGIVSIVISLFCALGVITAIMAVIFGGIGIAQANQGRARGKGMAVTGVVLGIISVALYVLALVLLVSLGFPSMTGVDSPGSGY